RDADLRARRGEARETEPHSELVEQIAAQERVRRALRADGVDQLGLGGTDLSEFLVTRRPRLRQALRVRRLQLHTAIDRIDALLQASLLLRDERRGGLSQRLL